MNTNYLSPVLRELRDQQIRFAPREKKIEQVNRAERLLAEIKPGKIYTYEYICYRITDFRPESSANAKLIQRMAAQEQRHLARFDSLMAERRVRPTALQPLWNVAGFALGAVTALISEEAALACTEAVETEIDRHYQRQLDELGNQDPVLSADIAEFQAEEVEHRESAVEHGSGNAPGHPARRAGAPSPAATEHRATLR